MIANRGGPSSPLVRCLGLADTAQDGEGDLLGVESETLGQEKGPEAIVDGRKFVLSVELRLEETSELMRPGRSNPKLVIESGIMRGECWACHEEAPCPGHPRRTSGSRLNHQVETSSKIVSSVSLLDTGPPHRLRKPS